jgi:hypothetical protein
MSQNAERWSGGPAADFLLPVNFVIVVDISLRANFWRVLLRMLAVTARGPSLSNYNGHHATIAVVKSEACRKVLGKKEMLCRGGAQHGKTCPLKAC